MYNVWYVYRRTYRTIFSLIPVLIFLYEKEKVFVHLDHP